MTNQQVRNHIIKTGVIELKGFGHNSVNTKNILINPIFIGLFRRILDGIKGTVDTQVDNIVDDIIGEFPVETETVSK